MAMSKCRPIDPRQGRKTKHPSIALCKAIVLHLLANRPMQPLLMHNAPQANNDASDAREKRDVVCSLVAAESVLALAVPVRANHGVFVVEFAVEQVIDIAADDRRKGHYTPVLRKTADSKCMGDQRREDAEEKAVCNSRKPRDNNQLVGMRDCGPGKLSQREHNRRGKQAPETRQVEPFDQQVGADAYETVSFCKTMDLEDVPLDRRPMKLPKDSTDTCITCLCCMNLELALSS